MSKTKNRLVLYLSLLAISIMILSCGEKSPTKPSKTTVSGTLILPQEAEGKEYWVIIDNDSNGDNGYVALTFGTCGPGTTLHYSIDNVASGTYYIYAGVRVLSAQNNPPQNGDYLGFYGGTLMNPPDAANAVVPSSGTATFDINLEIMGGGSGVWITRSPMSKTRTSLGPHAALVNGLIYVIGGFDGVNDLSSGEVYDPVADTWDFIESMPTPRSQCDLAVVDGKIYVIGGTSNFPYPTSTLLEYDPTMDSWTVKSDMPTPRRLLSASVIDDQIYVMGGIDSSETYLSTVELYNPATDSWTTKTRMNFAKSSMTSSVINGRIYVLGGFEYGVPASTIEEYDPSTDTWGIIPTTITPRNLFTSAVFDDKIYAIGGGAIPNVGISDLVEEINPKTSSVEIRASMPTARAALASVITEGKIYVIGGRTADDNISNILEEYTPPQ
jgi:N-acetylneuraminic acid mutarotase